MLVQVTGTGFIAASVVVFDGTDHATTFVSATQLTFDAQPVAEGVVDVQVRNPPSQLSNTVTFTVLPAAPLLAVTSLNPDEMELP